MNENDQIGREVDRSILDLYGFLDVTGARTLSDWETALFGGANETNDVSAWDDTIDGIEEDTLLPSVLELGVKLRGVEDKVYDVGDIDLPKESTTSRLSIKEAYYFSLVDNVKDSVSVGDKISASHFAIHAGLIDIIYELGKGSVIDLDNEQVLSYGPNLEPFEAGLLATPSSFNLYGPTNANLSVLERDLGEAKKLTRLRYLSLVGDIESVSGELKVLTGELYARGVGTNLMRENPYRSLYKVVHEGLVMRQSELVRSKRKPTSPRVMLPEIDESNEITSPTPYVAEPARISFR